MVIKRQFRCFVSILVLFPAFEHTSHQGLQTSTRSGAGVQVGTIRQHKHAIQILGDPLVNRFSEATLHFQEPKRKRCFQPNGDFCRSISFFHAWPLLVYCLYIFPGLRLTRHPILDSLGWFAIPSRFSRHRQAESTLQQIHPQLFLNPHGRVHGLSL